MLFRVRRLVGATCLLLPLLANNAPAAPGRTRARTTEFTAAELAQGFTNQTLLARPRAGASGRHDAAAEAACANAEAAAGFTLEDVYERFDGLRVLRVPNGQSPAAAIAQLQATGRYAYVEVDRIVRPDATPTDPLYADGTQWWLHNTGQTGGRIDADIGAVTAWNLRNDASTVIVAIVDSGARLTHQDIAPNLWTNPREIPGNGRDDDGNGYIDDVHGIDARLGTGDPTDPPDFGHGTHVTGIIGAAANNGVAGAGVAWRVQLMPLLFLGGDSHGGTISDEIECIDYAIAQGARVINASFGSSQFSQAERDAIERARAADIVFVCAAGNDSNDLGLTDHFPVGHLVDNIVGVGNSDRRDELFFTSNFSAGCVDLVAPGTEIVSLGSTSDTATKLDTGSSMSSPLVAGAVALLRAQFPGDTYRASINRLLRGTRPLAPFRGLVQTGGRLDLAGALTTTDTRPFNDDFAARAVLQGEVIRVRTSTVGASAESTEPAHAGQLARSLWFSWTAPADGTVTLDSVGSAVDAQIAVYTGDQLAALTLVAANDNEGAGSTTARLTFTARADTTYAIAVDGTSAGLVALNLSAAAANDAFVSAVTLNPAEPRVTVSNANATRENGEPTPVSGTNGRTLWFRWTAPASGPVQASADALSANPVLAVYTGTNLTALTTVGSNNNSGVGGANLNALVSFNAVAHTTYALMLDTTGTVVGPVTLSISNARWQFATGNASDSNLRQPAISAPPAVGPDGAIYVGSTDHYFYALNPDGTLRWRTAVEVVKKSLAPAITGAAVAADGTIHFGTNAGVAYALNPDGTMRWSAPLNAAAVLAPPAVAADGTTYYPAEDGTLWAFSPTGSVVWTYATVGRPTFGSPTIAPDGAIHLPASDGTLHALNPGTGTRRWRFQPELANGSDDATGISTAPAIDADGQLYAATTRGTVFSLTAAGALRWTFRSTGEGEIVASSLALGEGRVYFGTAGGFLYALNQVDGNEVWRQALGAPARLSSPALAADGSIIIGNDANRLLRFSRDGDLLQSWLGGSGFGSSPVIADGRVYAGNTDGKLYVFDLGSVGPAVGAAFPWPQFGHGPRRLGRATVESIGQRITPVPADPGRLVNLSVSNRTTRGDGVLTAGFVLAGDVSKELVVRGIGPTLADFGVNDVVGATELKVYRIENLIPMLEAGNVSWNTSDGRDLGAFPLPAGSADSVVRRSFAAAPFSAQVLPRTDATAPGIALVEIYDGAINDLRAHLTNLSARTTVTANADVAVGFVLAGQTPRQLLIRAVGPGLVPFGVNDALADPRLLLYAGPIAEAGNDDWNGNASVIAAAQRVGAFALDSTSRDAVLLTTLPPGAYSARVRGPAGASGIVLVEVYLLPE